MFFVCLRVCVCVIHVGRQRGFWMFCCGKGQLVVPAGEKPVRPPGREDVFKKSGKRMNER